SPAMSPTPAARPVTERLVRRPAARRAGSPRAAPARRAGPSAGSPRRATPGHRATAPARLGRAGERRGEEDEPRMDHARAVIIGGGVGGTSIAYHLAERGWTDIVLVDRAELTSGSTFHSAGLVGQLR